MNPLVWIDCETTGLDPDEDIVLEIGLVATDDRLQRFDGVSDFQSVVQPPNGLDIMRLHPAVVEMHAQNGLLTEIAAGKGGSKLEVGDSIKGWLTTVRNVYFNTLNTSEPGSYDAVRLLMAGSTVGQFDRQFFANWLPDLMAMFSYRVLDVSSVKELVGRVYGEDATYSEDDALKDGIAYKAHRVLPDIDASIAELQFYVNTYLKEASS